MSYGLEPYGFSPSLVEEEPTFPFTEDQKQRAFMFIDRYIEEMQEKLDLEPPIRIRPEDIRYEFESDPEYRRLLDEDGFPIPVEQMKLKFMLSPRGGIT